MLSRRLKIGLNYFLTILTENKIKVTSSGTSPASIDKVLKMALTPPGGRDEGVKVKHIVEQTIRNHP